MEKLLLYIILLILLITGIINPCIAGKYGADFLEIGIGAKALSMGSAFCSLADDGTAFYWNPSGLALIKQRLFSGMYGQQFGTLNDPFANFHYIGLVQPLAGNATVAFNWIRLSVDDIPEYPELLGENYLDRLYNSALRPTGDPVGYFSDTEDAFFFSFSKLLTSEFNMGWNYQDVRLDIPIGINFKWIRQSLHTYHANGLGIDLGAMFRVHFSDLFISNEFGVFSIGLNLQDFTTTHLKWNTRHEDPVGMNAKWGISYKQPLPFSKHYLIFSHDWDNRWGGRKHYGFGYSAFDRFSIRMGMDGQNLTGGVGLSIWRFGVDYAFLTHELSHLHRISCFIRL